MPERSFGRTVRYRRTKLGLSQAQLGELVGRSASSIRSWERDVSVPTDAGVITALSAILDLDQEALFAKAGMDMPVEETHPTIEEALASLAPLPLDEAVTVEEIDLPEPSRADEPAVLVDLSSPMFDEEPEPEPDLDSGLEAEAREHLGGAAVPVPVPDREPADMLEASKTRSELAGAPTMRRTTEPAFVSPPEPFLITAPTPPAVEPSYMEDNQQRQLYRVRNLATIVLVVALIVVFLWSLSNAIDAFGTWWEDFFGSLRL
jgi:transcriptional regulator with XRE-family HTH domain